VIGFMPDVDENGVTLRENAHIKATAARKALECYSAAKANDIERAIVVAEDSGLFVDCLGGGPGAPPPAAPPPAPSPAPPAKPAVELDDMEVFTPDLFLPGTRR
ncbi:MAG: non-canonical purine NTP pyrophosphatase, partial [Planctomycetes bacterium]|nr:non-canonical purine NTP pyrophosphatase [Planctomycetota bacterium]